MTVVNIFKLEVWEINIAFNFAHDLSFSSKIKPLTLTQFQFSASKVFSFVLCCGAPKSSAQPSYKTNK